MSDYEDNSRKSDYEGGSGWNDDDEDDDDGGGGGMYDDENNEMENDENNDGIEDEDEGVGSGSYCGSEKDDPDIPLKRPRFDSSSQNNSDDQTVCETSSTEPVDDAWSKLPFASRIMGKMGHKPGTGLGKHGQGIVEPLAASKQKGTRGFGYCPDESKLNRVVDPEVECISVKEHAEWLINTHPVSDMLTRDDLKTWIKQGPRKLSYEDEYYFCEPKVFLGILEAKNNLDDKEKSIKDKSIWRANPFEAIKGGIFLNRAAMKMANMDYVFDYMFTNPKDKNGKEIIGPNDLLYFADVCAGPGGFSEYIFFRKKWRAKGFGFTLREKNDFKLDEFFAGPSETFEAHYGVPIEKDLGDGDILKSENVNEFCSFVKKNTDGLGVHFMMADGGFEINEKSYQEILSKQLYLCQCLVALKVVRKNGNFVVKLFDLFTRFSVGLVYLMYRSFERISIHKPNTSRPANSERYLVCQYKRSGWEDVADYMQYVNELLCEKYASKEDIMELVPPAVMQNDKDFYDYIVKSNNSWGKRQTFHLQNIIHYIDFPDLTDSRQAQFKEECLKLWQVPNEARTDPYKKDAKSAMKLLGLNDSDTVLIKYVRFSGGLLGYCLSKSSGRIERATKRVMLTSFLREKAEKINKTSLEKIGPKGNDWYWTVVESEETSDSLTFYLGLKRENVYKYVHGSWVKFQDSNVPHFKLPAGTLVYGEIVREHIWSPDQCKVLYHVNAFHIVDGLFLGHEDIRKECLLYRNKCCEMFAKALSCSNMIYRVKKLNALMEDPYCDLSLTLSKSVRRRALKNRKQVLGYNFEENRFIVPGGLLFFPRTNDNWKRCLSKGKSEYYYFNSSKGYSKWENSYLEPSGRLKKNSEFKQIFTDFQKCFANRRVWWLNERDLEELAFEN